MHGIFDIEIILLVLESVLLLATVILLVYSIKEGKHRDKLIMEVGKATRVLTRQEYFLTVMDSMMEAEKEVVGSITGRSPGTHGATRVKHIVENIEKMKGKGVGVKYLIPKFADRIHVGSLYAKAGAEVRYSDCLMVQDLRYLVVDHRWVILGIPEHTGNREATRKGYKIPSEGLAHLLEENFRECWDASVPYEDYVRQILKKTGAPPHLLARELHVDAGELERLSRES
ncbi:MAG: hypothetical protein R3231_00555 [bacterium]|nr:hypothetical protein [bacterium]